MAEVTAVAEENDAGIILFASEYPGTCGWGRTAAEAREKLRADLRATVDWLAGHGIECSVPALGPEPVSFEITERIRATGDPLVCDSEGFFAFDSRPYSDAEISQTRAMLTASRGDLLDLVAELDPRSLDHRLAADRRTVREILDHVAGAEHWYLTRVVVPVDVPDSWRHYAGDTFDRLAETRRDVDRTLESLRDVPDSRRGRTRVVDGERWSRRKLLRRLVWHERLHGKQLARLVPKFDAVAERGDR